MNKENCALKLVKEIILYYDERSKKHQITFRFVFCMQYSLKLAIFILEAIEKRNRMKTDLGLLELGFPLFQFFRNQTRVEDEGGHFQHQI